MIQDNSKIIIIRILFLHTNLFLDEERVTLLFLEILNSQLSSERRSNFNNSVKDPQGHGVYQIEGQKSYVRICAQVWCSLSTDAR